MYTFESKPRRAPSNQYKRRRIINTLFFPGYLFVGNFSPRDFTALLSVVGGPGTGGKIRTGIFSWHRRRTKIRLNYRRYLHVALPANNYRHILQGTYRRKNGKPPKNYRHTYCDTPPLACVRRKNVPDEYPVFFKDNMNRSNPGAPLSHLPTS